MLTSLCVANVGFDAINNGVSPSALSYVFKHVHHALQFLLPSSLTEEIRFPLASRAVTPPFPRTTAALDLVGQFAQGGAEALGLGFIAVHDRILKQSIQPLDLLNLSSEASGEGGSYHLSVASP